MDRLVTAGRRLGPDLVLAGLALAALLGAGAALGVPLWLYLGLVVVALGLVYLARRVIGTGSRTAVETLATAVIAYGSGWGPALGLAFVAPLVQASSRGGAAAIRPAAAWSVAAIALGQLATELGIAPAFLEVSASHGVAAVGALALIAVARRLHATTDARERADASLRADISRREELEAELEHQAFHDALTGLANRAKFTDRVEHVVARAGRREQRFAVLFLDLDGFKEVNDTLGHEAGDDLLVEVAARLREAVRDVDTPARFGGDEFAVLLEQLRDSADAVRVADRILSAVRQPVELTGGVARVDASIGIAVTTGAESAGDLLRNADIAMYSAKHGGKGRYEVFEPAMHLESVERLQLERELAAAIGNDELVLHYQPIVALADERIVGVEALVRWQHPQRGLLGPGEFIPLAEETGLIVPLGRWVLTRACEQVAAWQRRNGSSQLGLSINVSAGQLVSGDLVADVARSLAASGLTSGSLTLEITESAVLQDTEATLHVLRELKYLGVRLAIDDFGTGYSALSYLQRFPFDELKIDRSFIERLSDDSQDSALVRAMVDISRSMNLRTVAEGIEHREQATRTRLLRCELGQGYLFARPGTAERTAELLAAHAPQATLIDLVAHEPADNA